MPDPYTKQAIKDAATELVLIANKERLRSSIANLYSARVVFLVVVPAMLAIASAMIWALTGQVAFFTLTMVCGLFINLFGNPKQKTK